MASNNALHLSFSVILAVLISIMLSYSAFALGASPGKIVFDNLVSDGFSSTQLLISTSSIEEETISLGVEGELADWITLEPNQSIITVSRGNPYLLDISIHPGLDAATLTYQGNIIITKINLGPMQQQYGAFVSSELILPITAQVSNEKLAKCSLGGFKIFDTEENSYLLVSFQLYNQGNVRIYPEPYLRFYDPSGRLVFEHEETLDSILPSKKEKINLFFPHKLSKGSYTLIFGIPQCESQQSEQLRVLEKGSLSEEGTFASLENKPYVYIGEQTQINAEFENKGMTPVYSRLVVDVKKDDKSVALLESDKLLVLAGDTQTLSAYFMPKIPGKYYLGAKIVYGSTVDKQTFSQGSVLEAAENPDQPAGESSVPKIVSAIILVIILIVILNLIIKIVKHKKNGL